MCWPCSEDIWDCPQELQEKYKDGWPKISDGGKVDGRGPLTDNFVDRMQKYYGRAMRENTGHLDKMKNSVWTIYHHMIKDDSCTLEEQHKLCPKGEGSWCKFWKALKEYKEDNRLFLMFLLISCCQFSLGLVMTIY